MSYLDLPRFHLSGRFFANPSTINNEAVNYGDGQPLNSGPANKPGAVGWNPPGQALWTLSTSVQTVVGPTGVPVASGDALVGGTLVSVDTPYKAKLVDLDPQQQMLSQVWGLSVSLALSNGVVAFTGTVAECALTDVWGRVSGGSAGGIEAASGMFQTVIQVSAWGDLSASPVLQALHGQAGDTLSLKWVVDGYNGQFGTAGFGWGRMVATVGPYHAGEPTRFLGGRRLDSPSGTLWLAPFQVDAERSVLALDLGNSVSTTAGHGGPFALDTITPVLDPQGQNLALAPLAYSLDTYTATAGIYEVPLTADQLALLASRPLALRGSGPGSATGSIAEAADGTWAAMDPQFMRLDPGESGPVTFYARQWGRPWDTSLTVQPYAIPNNSDNTGIPKIVGGTDPHALKVNGQPTPATVTTAGGTAQATLTGGMNPPPAEDRAAIDGQVYNLAGPWWSQTMLQGVGVPAMAVLVFDAFTPATDPPTWWADIQPWMYQYARLYPGMRDIMDISDYGTLTSTIRGMGKTGAQLVDMVFQLPRTDPNHMPVTRDLSGGRRRAFADWVAAGCPEGTAPADFTPAGAPRQPGAPAPADPGTLKSALVEDRASPVQWGGMP